MSDIADRLRAALADRYLIEEEIGRGGAATVYLAEDLKHARKVAIKVLRPGTRRATSRSASCGRSGSPPAWPIRRSCRCTTRASADGLLYFVMPYAGCETLRDRLDARGAAAGRRGAPHHPGGGRRRSATPTGSASSTATSSRRTSCCRKASRSSPISASPRRSPPPAATTSTSPTMASRSARRRT